MQHIAEHCSLHATKINVIGLIGGTFMNPNLSFCWVFSEYSPISESKLYKEMVGKMEPWTFGITLNCYPITMWPTSLVNDQQGGVYLDVTKRGQNMCGSWSFSLMLATSDSFPHVLHRFKYVLNCIQSLQARQFVWWRLIIRICRIYWCSTFIDSQQFLGILAILWHVTSGSATHSSPQLSPIMATPFFFGASVGFQGLPAAQPRLPATWRPFHLGPRKRPGASMAGKKAAMAVSQALNMVEHFGLGSRPGRTGLEKSWDPPQHPQHPQDPIRGTGANGGGTTGTAGTPSPLSHVV